jgi:tetratricopeptide (TPR) repeat protein
VAKRPSLVPPADLLGQMEGVESALRRGKKLGIVGWAAFAASALQFVVLALTTDGWDELASIDRSRWPFLIAVLLLGLSILLINWRRVWLRESREPFRYTFSIADFERVCAEPDEQQPSWTVHDGVQTAATKTAEPPLAWLRHDLSKRLSNLRRLSLLDEQYSGTTQEPEAHVHIGGTYGFRETDEGDCVIEVLPWVRLGPSGSPARLSHPVKFGLSRRSSLDVASYEKLRERVYFSIASELYSQIRRDVQQKIDLLPKRYFRAAAYFYEARDFARSNTLDAYEHARDLYQGVLGLYDPLAWTFATSPRRQLVLRLAARAPQWALGWRRRVAMLWPRFGRVEIMVAQAEIGYANALLDRHVLAGMAGQRMNPIFEALPVASNARDRLDNLRDVPGWHETRFDAEVTLAATYALLGSAFEANALLREARRLDPARAEEHPRYLYVKGELETQPKEAVKFLRRAVELAPGFEAAQFRLATRSEMFWRSRPTFEVNVALMVTDEYEQVIDLNPGNIAAWANLGYMHWLLRDRDAAQKAFERGREYKEIQRETFVAELDYGLARLAAERGDFEKAYRAYVEATSAQLSHRSVEVSGEYTGYYFQRIDRAMVARFAEYKDAVRERREQPRGGDRGVGQRVVDSVYAFVLNDFAEACFNYFLRSCDEWFLKLAHDALKEAARELGTRYPMVYRNLHRVLSGKQDYEAADRELERFVAEAPHWEEGKLELAVWQSSSVPRIKEKAARVREQRRELMGEACRRREEARQREQEARNALFNAVEGTPESDSVAPWSALVDHRPDSHDGERHLPPRGDSGTHAPVVGPADVMARREIEQIRQAVADGRAEARKLRREAKRLERRANALEKEALSAPAGLLPHAWLWLDRGCDFDFSVFDRQGYKRERKLERELDPLHVRALQVWCTNSLRRKVGEDGERAQEASGTAGLLSLLEHLHERFLPDDFETLLTRRTYFCQNEDDDTRLRSLIRTWAQLEPAYWSLLWVVASDPGLFEPEKAAEILEQASATRDVPDRLQVWIGDELDALAEAVHEREASVYRRRALDAYMRALSSEDDAILFDLGERLEARGAFDESLRAYRRSRDVAGGAGLPPRRAIRGTDKYHIAIGRVLCELGRFDEAIAELSAVDARVAAEPWRAGLVAGLVAHNSIVSAGNYRAVKDWLGRLLTCASALGPGAQTEDTADALLTLTLRRYAPLLRRADDPEGPALTEATLPYVTPVVLQADDQLFPQGRETEQVERMLKTPDGDIARLRERVKERTGVTIPGINIRGSLELVGGRYTILLDEVPVAAGVAGPGVCFVADAEAARRLDGTGTSAPNPLGGEGLWLVEGAEAGQLETWDRYEYMLRHVEAVVLRNLDAYVGIQDVARLLTDWEEVGGVSDPSRSERHELRERAVATIGANVRLASVLQALVREGVPITDLGTILDTFARVDDGRGREELVEAVREALARSLPGLAASMRLVRLPPELEDAVGARIHVADGASFLALTGKEAEDVRSALRALAADLGAGASALVVSDARLRPLVRRLLELDHPELPVVAIGDHPDAPLLSIEWGAADPEVP